MRNSLLTKGKPPNIPGRMDDVEDDHFISCDPEVDIVAPMDGEA
jgi:hypothetical protein